MALRTKLRKNGTLAIYDGRKLATPEQEKQFIKKNYDIVNPETLSKENRAYLGRVKGGISRSNNALTVKGKFLPKNLQEKAIKNLGIDLEKIKETKNYDTLKQLFENQPEIKNRLDKLMSKTGIEYWFNTHSYAQKMEEYVGRIFINGKELPPAKAIKAVGDRLKQLKRKFDFVDASVKFNYIGLEKLNIDIPDKEEIEEADEEEINEGGLIQIYTSGKNGKKK